MFDSDSFNKKQMEEASNLAAQLTKLFQLDGVAPNVAMTAMLIVMSHVAVESQRFSHLASPEPYYDKFRNGIDAVLKTFIASLHTAAQPHHTPEKTRH